MATYKEISGTNVEAVSSDPSNPVQGQVWYNTTTGALKGSKSFTNIWSTGGNLNTPRYFSGGKGSQTSALCFGGADGPSENLSVTEQYNGTTWTETTDLNTGRSGIAASGIDNTSIAAVNGFQAATYYSNVELWNGSNWTETTDTNTTNVSGRGGVGVSNTSTLVFGGSINGAPPTANVELWNGSSWTETTNLNINRRFPGGAGIVTAALAFGGNQPPVQADTELWNGSNWTEVANMNTARTRSMSFGTSNTAALVAGGEGGPPGQLVEVYNGTSWSETTDMSTARSNTASGAGSTTAGLVAGGQSGGSKIATTEEWNNGPLAQTFTTS